MWRIKNVYIHVLIASCLPQDNEITHPTHTLLLFPVHIFCYIFLLQGWSKIISLDLLCRLAKMSSLRPFINLALLLPTTINALATNLAGTYQQYAAADYGLVATYDSNFQSEFSFYTGADPTEGYGT
jgi:hypothetical protein